MPERTAGADLRERAERILTDVIDSGYIIGALSPPWSTKEKAIRSIMGQLAAHTESLAAPRIEDGLRELAEQLIAWDTKWPKSFVMNHSGVLESERQLDAIVVKFRAALAATPKENANE